MDQRNPGSRIGLFRQSIELLRGTKFACEQRLPFRIMCVSPIGIVTGTSSGRLSGDGRDWRHEDATSPPLPPSVPRRDHQPRGLAREAGVQLRAARQLLSEYVGIEEMSVGRSVSDLGRQQAGHPLGRGHHEGHVGRGSALRPWRSLQAASPSLESRRSARCAVAAQISATGRFRLFRPSHPALAQHRDGPPRYLPWQRQDSQEVGFCARDRAGIDL
jgi:hypothetical protein